MGRRGSGVSGPVLLYPLGLWIICACRVMGQLPGGNVLLSPAELFASVESSTTSNVLEDQEVTSPVGSSKSGSSNEVQRFLTTPIGLVAGPARLNDANKSAEDTLNNLNGSKKNGLQFADGARTRKHGSEVPIGLDSSALTKEEQRLFSEQLRSIIGLQLPSTSSTTTTTTAVEQPSGEADGANASTATEIAGNVVITTPAAPIDSNASTVIIEPDDTYDDLSSNTAATISPGIFSITLEGNDLTTAGSFPGDDESSSTQTPRSPGYDPAAAVIKLDDDSQVHSPVRGVANDEPNDGEQAGAPSTGVTAPSRLVTPVLLSSTKKEPGPTVPNPTFVIRRDPSFPHAIMIIEYKPDNVQQHFRVNFTDLSTLSGFPPASYLVASNPFFVHQLAPGHQYEFKIYSIPSGPGEKPVLIHSEIQWTDPIVPTFSLEHAEVTTDSIKLIAVKGRDYLQDYFTVSYTQIDPTPEKRHIPLNITDSPNSQQFEILLKKLHPGTMYNITVQAFRIGRASKPWSATVSTVPNPPESLEVKEKGTHNLFISWDVPKDSGFDSYHLSWVPSDVDEANLEEIPDIILQSTMYNITGLDPGKRYRLQVFTKKDDRISIPAVLQDVFTKPLPPNDITIEPDFDSATFKSIVRLPVGVAGALYAGCRLQFFDQSILAQSVVKLELNASVSVYDTNICEFYLPAQGEFVLRPSEKYEVKAWAMSGGPETESEPLRRSVTIAPAFNETLFGLTFAAGYNSLRVEWPDLPFWNGIVGAGSNLTARLKLVSGVAGSSVAVKTKSGERGGSLEFDGLMAGACYQWEIFTMANQERSEDKVVKYQRTDLPGLDVGEPEVTSNSAVLSVIVSDGEVEFSSTCRLQINVVDNNQLIMNKSISLEDSIVDDGTDRLVRIPVNQLSSFKIYSFEGWVVCGSEPDGGLCGPLLYKTIHKRLFKTSENVPGQVEGLQASAQEPFKARLAWTQTDSSNGDIEGYLIHIEPEARSSELPWNVSLDRPVVVHDVDNLTGGFEYTFQVRARTKAGYGPPSLPFTTRMPIKAPPDMGSRPHIIESSVREHDFSISFSLATFSSMNGLIIKYAVIVAEVEGLKFSTSVAKNGENWTLVKDRDHWPPYIAIMMKLASPSKELDPGPTILLVGVDGDCMNPREGFCNGPLRPNTEYQIKIRAYTDWDKYTDTPFSAVVQTKAVTPVTKPAIVAIVVVVLLGVALLCAVLFFRSRRTDPLSWCKSMLQREDVGRMQKPEAPPNVRIERIPQLQPLPTILPGYDLHRHRPVHQSRFAEHVRLMSADSDFRFSEEYEDLRNIGRNQPCSAADMSCNRVKNRFSNILPYDHSRVKLIPIDDEEGSDYINANYIPGFNSPREFIAAQGPLSGTVDDFWQMIWETNSRCIVNLARCIEKGREKCHQYWPDDTDPVTYGDFEVHLMTETRYPDWTIREFKMTDTGLDATDQKSRTVRQFHYTAWPDFGVPEHPESLLKFVRVFRARTPGNSPPVVVHCSAGVGRSGTFMTIDRSILQLDTSDLIDIFGIVYEMRMDRVLMVQNEQQYICIHQCLLCVITGEEEYPALPPIPSLSHSQYGDTPQSGRHSNSNHTNYYNQHPHYQNYHRGNNLSGNGGGEMTHNSSGSLVGNGVGPGTNSITNLDSATLASNHTANSVVSGSTATVHGHGRVGPGEIHQNPVFEDDEGIVESGV